MRVLHKVPQFRKDEFFAGKLAGLETSWDAKDEGLTDQACCGPGKEGGRVDFFIAQLCKEGPKSSELFGEHGSDCLDSHIITADPRASSHENCMRAMLLNDRADRIGNHILVVRDHLVKNHFMLFLLGPFFHPVSALVIGKAASAGYSQNRKYK